MSGERQTRDFMSVDSFSQLPFIRPAPVIKEKTSNSNNNGIRLFGIEFPNENDVANREEDSSSLSSTSKENGSGGAVLAANANSGGGSGGESSRKFECHYCCRKFPTSQALGGHQNAHKRERQHAKRAHLQSALAAAASHHHGFLDGHLYGLANYYRHLGAVHSPARFGIATGHTFDPLPSYSYPSWGAAVGGNLTASGPKFYGGPVSSSLGAPQLNGNPFQGMWSGTGGGGGLPVAIHRERPSMVPYMEGDNSNGSRVVVGGFGSMLSSSTQSRAATASVKENLSLDLHL